MPPTIALTLPQKLALIDAWPCPVRVCRDLDCPACGYGELGQTLMSELPALLYCRRCGWARTEPLSWLWGSAAKIERDPLEALAYIAVRSWNRDVPLLTREQAKPLALVAADTARRAGLGRRFAEWCADVGPVGSRIAATRLVRQAFAEQRGEARP